jgi:hypothetical protein
MYGKEINHKILEEERCADVIDAFIAYEPSFVEVLDNDSYIQLN